MQEATSLADGAPVRREAAPMSVDQRIQPLDVLRGVAVLGILLMNVVAFGLPGVAYFDPSRAGGADGANLVAWVVEALLLEGTMRTLFSLLFGAGIVLLTSRLEQRPGVMVADIYLRRNMWLIVFGLVHSYLLLWTGDILYTYGICGMLLFVCRKLRPRTLVILGLVVLALLVPRRLLHQVEVRELQAAATRAEAVLEAGGTLDQELARKVQRWTETRTWIAPTEEDLAAEVARHRAGYLDLVASTAARARRVHTTSLYDTWLLDALGVMLIGMGLLKLGVITGARSVRFYVWWTVAAYGVGLAVNAREACTSLSSWFDPEVLLRLDLTYDLGRVAVAAGHLGLVMLVCRLGLLRRFASCLAAAGRMALTNYIAQTVICISLFSGFGLALFGAIERWQLYLVVAAIWALELLWSALWLRWFRFGPLEWLWRSLSYWHRQPMRVLRPQ